MEQINFTIYDAIFHASLNFFLGLKFEYQTQIKVNCFTIVYKCLCVGRTVRSCKFNFITPSAERSTSKERFGFSLQICARVARPQVF